MKFYNWVPSWADGWCQLCPLPLRHPGTTAGHPSSSRWRCHQPQQTRDAELNFGQEDDNDSFVTFQVPQNCQCQQSPGLHRQQGCQAGVHRSWGWDKNKPCGKDYQTNNFVHCRNCWRQCEDDSWYDLDHHLEVRMLVTAVLFLSIFCQRQVVNFTANFIFYLLLCTGFTFTIHCYCWLCSEPIDLF